MNACRHTPALSHYKLIYQTPDAPMQGLCRVCPGRRMFPNLGHPKNLDPAPVPVPNLPSVTGYWSLPLPGFLCNPFDRPRHPYGSTSPARRYARNKKTKVPTSVVRCAAVVVALSAPCGAVPVVPLALKPADRYPRRLPVMPNLLAQYCLPNSKSRLYFTV
jgi:hypothetical protein